MSTPRYAALNPAPSWYVAYGSNMDPLALNRYLTPQTAVEDVRNVKLDREVYFAGRSKTWGAAVAFLTLHAVPEVVTHARAFLLPHAAFADLAWGENGLDADPGLIDSAMASLNCDEHADLGLKMDDEGYRGKYNALLRLQDIEGVSAYTLTTSHSLVRGEPAADYLKLITQAKRSAT